MHTADACASNFVCAQIFDTEQSGCGAKAFRNFKRYGISAGLSTLSSFPLSTRRWDRSRLFGLSSIFSILMISTTIAEQPRAEVTGVFFVFFVIKLVSFFVSIFTLKATADTGQRGLGIFRLSGADSEQMNHWTVKGKSFARLMQVG